MFHSKKSVSLVAEIMSSTKWLKFKENQVDNVNSAARKPPSLNRAAVQYGILL